MLGGSWVHFDIIISIVVVVVVVVVVIVITTTTTVRVFLLFAVSTYTRCSSISMHRLTTTVCTVIILCPASIKFWFT